jgi:tRNA G18 (ribose-2'-O)-methylase SpoU
VLEKNSRFWSKTFDIPFELKSDPKDRLSLIESVTDWIATQHIEIPKSENAIVLIPRFQLLVPLSNGIIQTQHISQLEETAFDSSLHHNSNKVLVFGFFPRAQIVNEEHSREINEERLQALNEALKAVTDISIEDLTVGKYAGSPPSKMYRSFIAPRANAQYVHDVTKAAQQAAHHIDFALRQLRADEAAAYLRNHDNSIQSRKAFPIALVLDNIRSAFNVGSMFRTAETAGIQELVTCGITAHPPHPKLQKTALTALDLVPTRHFEETTVAVQKLREEGYKIVSLETTTLSKKYTEICFPIEKTAVIVGNELTGVDPRILEKSDMIIEIPVYGVKNSLNVASAASIMLFEVIRQWELKNNIAKNEKDQ